MNLLIFCFYSVTTIPSKHIKLTDVTELHTNVGICPFLKSAVGNIPAQFLFDPL